MQYHEKNSSVPFYAYNFIALVRGHTCKPQLRLKHFSLKFANISDVIWKQFAWRQRDVASFAFASNDTIQRWRHRRSKKLNKNGTGGDRHLMVRFLFAVGGAVLMFFLFGKPYKRGFFCNDESLYHPFHTSTVTSAMLYVIGLLLPICTVSHLLRFFISLVRKEASDDSSTTSLSFFLRSGYFVRGVS